MDGTRTTVDRDKLWCFRSCQVVSYMVYMPYSLPSTEGGVGGGEKGSLEVAFAPLSHPPVSPCHKTTTVSESREEMPMITSHQDGPSADEFEEMLTQLGGVRALRDDPNNFRGAVKRLWDERDSLIEQHPNKWISMGKDGVVSIGDSIEEVVSATEAKGISTADVIVELLDPEPEALIL